MKELIKVTTNDKGQIITSAKELHKLLKVGSKFNDWIKRRIKKYNFIENIDYTIVNQKKQAIRNNDNAKITILEKNYLITLEMAKELSTIENTKYSKEIIEYLVDCEKNLDPIKTSLLEQIYNGGQEGLNASKKLIELERQLLLNIIKEQNPKVEYYNNVLYPTKLKHLETTTAIAKDLGTSTRKLNTALYDLGVQFKRSDCWVFTEKYEYLIREGYADYVISQVCQSLKWSEKGRKFIIDILDENGYLDSNGLFNK